MIFVNLFGYIFVIFVQNLRAKTMNEIAARNIVLQQFAVESIYLKFLTLLLLVFNDFVEKAKKSRTFVMFLNQYFKQITWFSKDTKNTIFQSSICFSWIFRELLQNYTKKNDISRIRKIKTLILIFIL